MRVFVDLCTFLTPQLLTRWYQLNVQVFCQWNSARPVLVQCVALAFLFMHWYYCVPCYQPCKVLYFLNGTEILPGVTYRKKKHLKIHDLYIVNCWIFWTAMPKRGIHIYIKLAIDMTFPPTNLTLFYTGTSEMAISSVQVSKGRGQPLTALRVLRR